MATFSDLAEHTGTLVSLIGALATLCCLLALIVWRIMLRVAFTLKTDILAMIDKLDSRIGKVWAEMGKIKDKQEKLREELPERYMRFDGPGYESLNNGINRIEAHFEKFAQDCRDGKCGGRVTK
jgi:hypothetical protein